MLFMISVLNKYSHDKVINSISYVLIYIIVVVIFLLIQQKKM